MHQYSAPFVLLARPLLVALLTVCTCTPLAAQQVSQEAVSSTEKIEIFYSSESHVAVHDLRKSSRSNLIGFGGLFGVVGVVAATAASVAATNAGFELAQERARAFTAAVQPAAQAQDMNREFAHGLARQFELAGKTVKLTEVPRLPGARPGVAPVARPVTAVGGPTGSSGAASGEFRALAQANPARAEAPMAGNGYTATPGFIPLLLRVTTGFTASEAAGEYKPLVEVEYAVVSPVNSRYLTDGKWVARNQPDGSTYATWDQLFADATQARSHVREALLATGEPVFLHVQGLGGGR